MKKIVYLLCVLSLVFSLAACGSDKKEDKSAKKEYLSEKEITKAFSDPDSYSGKYIKITGQVFGDVEYDDEGVYFQMYEDPEGYKNNAVIGYDDPDFEVKDGDYVIIDGIISGTFDGENAFGGSVSALKIVANKIEVSSYAEVMSPSVKTIEPLMVIRITYHHLTD